MAFAEGRVGAITVSDGSPREVRLDRFCALVTQDAAGKYYELSKQGRIFCGAMAAGASLGTALTATAVTLTLYNPSTSGVNVSLLQCSICLTTEVVNAEVGVIVYACNVVPSAAIPTTTTLLAAANWGPTLLGSAAAPLAQLFTAATLPATPVIRRVFPLAHNQVATTATALSGLANVDYVDGALCLAPNTAVTIQQIKTTADSGIVGYVWAEIPV